MVLPLAAGVRDVAAAMAGCGISARRLEASPGPGLVEDGRRPLHHQEDDAMTMEIRQMHPRSK
jgi:hypothetical protein